MSVYQVQNIIDGQPTFSKPLKEILAELQRGGALEVLSPLDYHTARQRAWYRGICLRQLSAWNGDTIEEWDARLKFLCGGDDLLKREKIYLGDGTGGCVKRMTIVGVGKKNMTKFIESILSKAIEMEWPVEPPNEELRR